MLLEVVDMLLNEVRNYKYVNGKIKNKFMYIETKLAFYSIKWENLNKKLKAEEKELTYYNNNNNKKQHNAQMIEMNRLKPELKNFTLLLHSNKEYYMKYKTTHDLLQKKKMEEMRNELKMTELQDKTIKITQTLNECQSLKT